MGESRFFILSRSVGRFGRKCICLGIFPMLTMSARCKQNCMQSFAPCWWSIMIKATYKLFPKTFWVISCLKQFPQQLKYTIALRHVWLLYDPKLRLSIYSHIFRELCKNASMMVEWRLREYIDNTWKCFRHGRKQIVNENFFFCTSSPTDWLTPHSCTV